MARRHGLEQFLEPRNVSGSSRALRRKGENTKKKATTSDDSTQYRFSVQYPPGQENRRRRRNERVYSLVYEWLVGTRKGLNGCRQWCSPINFMYNLGTNGTCRSMRWVIP